MFCTKFSLCFLWDQVTFSLSNSMIVVFLSPSCSSGPISLLNWWTHCCSQTSQLCLPTPPHPAFWPCWGHLSSLLIGLGTFTFLSLCLLSPISGPYSTSRTFLLLVRMMDMNVYLGFMVFFCTSSWESLEVSFSLWMFEHLSLCISVFVPLTDWIELTSVENERGTHSIGLYVRRFRVDVLGWSWLLEYLELLVYYGLFCIFKPFSKALRCLPE